MVEFVKAFVAFVFKYFSFNRKRGKRKILKRSFQKTAKSEKNIFRNILQPFEFLVNQPFVYLFCGKKISLASCRNLQFQKKT